MRITFLLPMGIERPSGRRYFNIARELVQLGHHVRLLALHPDLPACPQRRFVQAGVEVWYVGQMHVRKRNDVPQHVGPLALVGVLLRAVLGMVWGVLCSPADVYHLGKPQPVNGLAALLGVLLLRRRTFFVDCDDDEVGSNRLTAGWQRQVFAFWQTVLPRLARGITVNTAYLAERMHHHPPDRVVIVPNGVDLEHWQRPAPAQTAQLRTALGLDGRCIVAYVGTLALQNHPVDLLLSAFAPIADLFPDVDLLVVGSGEDAQRLQDQAVQLGIADRVHFVGSVDHRLVRDYLALATISVDPVHDDSVARARSPLKLFESMALGVPVITGDVGDRANLLDQGRAGMLVQGGNALALSAGLRTLLGDHALLQQYGVAAQHHVRRYSWATLASHWLTVYDPRPIPAHMTHNTHTV